MTQRGTQTGHALTAALIPAPAIARFLARVAFDVTHGGLVWTGARTPDGYGVVRIAPSGPGSVLYAHRLAATFALGSIPSDREVHHLCGLRSCVDPAHLRLVTGPENMAATGVDDAAVPF